MCGRYSLGVGIPDDNIQTIIQMCNSYSDDAHKISVNISGDICPADNAPVLMVANRKVTAVSMSWGIAAVGNKLIINARSEDLRQRPMFRGIADTQRCIIPAAGYYEWRDHDKLRHKITAESDKPIFFAGLYQSDARGQLHFVILTRAAIDEHSKIHSRMPCILFNREETREWLSGSMSPEELTLRPASGLKIEVQGNEQMSMFFDD